MNFIQSFRGCGKQFFFNNRIQFQVRPLRTFTPNTSSILFAKRPPLKANIFHLSFLKGVKFSSYSPLKSNLRRLFDGDTSRYARLNRFQAASPNYNNNGELLKLTLWGLGYMAVVYFATPYLFNMTPLSYFKIHPSHLAYAFIGINLAVFGMWQLPRFWVPLQRYALLRKDRIYSKLSLIGSTFSHQEFWHLAMNMMCLWSFGTSLVMLLGPANFTSLYLNCAMAGSLFSLWFPKIARLATMAPSLGASGALFGLFATFSYLVPHAKIMLFFIPIPVGAWFTFLGLTGWNVLGCTLRWGVLDYAAHLGGSALGVLYGWWISNRMKKQKAKRMLSFPRF